MLVLDVLLNKTPNIKEVYTPNGVHIQLLSCNSLIPSCCVSYKKTKFTLMSEFIHYLKVDYREVSLEMIINGLNDAIDSLKNQIDEIHWYDGD